MEAGVVFRAAGFGIEAVALAVGGGYAFAFRSEGAAGFCSVAAGCFALFFSSHGGFSMGAGLGEPGVGLGWVCGLGFICNGLRGKCSFF